MKSDEKLYAEPHGKCRKRRARQHKNDRSGAEQVYYVDRRYTAEDKRGVTAFSADERRHERDEQYGAKHKIQGFAYNIGAR
jgi:hypothetical protein